LIKKSSINTSAITLVLIILTAVTTPLIISPPVIHGKYVVIEKLVVINENNNIKYVSPLRRHATITPMYCQYCVQNHLSDANNKLKSITITSQVYSLKPVVLHYNYEILLNRTLAYDSVEERIVVLSLSELVNASSKPCVYKVLMDVVVYHREDGEANVSILMLNFKTPREGYNASIMYVKIYPKTRIPIPIGEVVVVEEPISILSALNAVNTYTGKHELSTIKSLSLDKPLQEAIKSLIRELHLKPETSKMLHGKIKFLIAVLMDPNECQTNQDCWEKYGYNYDYCYCTSTCVDINWWL